jgi:hypothetical protein
VRYIGTAGHCVLANSADKDILWEAGSGPLALDATGQRIGEFAYAVDLGSADHDFALIRLDEGVDANAAMCDFGGPTGINDDRTADPVVVHHYGQGLGLGEGVPGRTGLARGLSNPDSVSVFGLTGPGDSGSPLISADGRALGVILDIRVDSDPLEPAWVGVTRLTRELDRAQEQLGLDRLELVTAPRA